MRVALICHDSEPLTREGLARWLASFADLVGVVELREKGGRRGKRVRAELRRSGWVRFLDVMLFRLYYRLFLARTDRAWEQRLLNRLCERYPALPDTVPVKVAPSPNSEAVRAFLEAVRPDILIARCKVILKEEIFSIPPDGTFVMHPGICPEYRNAHGCFWAVATGDMERVGMTLLKIDRGIDTGPVYGYYKVDFDPKRESHVVLQHRVVFENLDALQARLQDIHAGRAEPLDTAGRSSTVWGQPWLTRYLRYRRREAVSRG